MLSYPYHSAVGDKAVKYEEFLLPVCEVFFCFGFDWLVGLGFVCLDLNFCLSGLVFACLVFKLSGSSRLRVLRF